MERGGADWLHVDVMDGPVRAQYPIGLPVVKERPAPRTCFLDVHLMILEPVRYAERFCDAGADMVSVHVEADTPRTSPRPGGDQGQGEDGRRRAQAATPAQPRCPGWSRRTLVLVMTVEPGFAGRNSWRTCCPRSAAARYALFAQSRLRSGDRRRHRTRARRPGNAAGCTMAVAGSAVFAGATAPRHPRHPRRRGEQYGEE